MKIKNITRIISIFSFIFFIALVSGNNASAHTNAKMEEKWETSKSIKSTKKGIQYHAYISKDKKEAWIYKIKIKSKKVTKLEFPSKIKGKKVTTLGAVDELYPDDREAAKLDACVNMLGEIFEPWHGGGIESTNKVKNIKLPNTVKQLASSTLAGFPKAKKIILSSKITTLKPYQFYGDKKLKSIYIGGNCQEVKNKLFGKCKSLKEIKFGKKVKIVDSQSIEECYSLKKIKVDKKNKYLSAKDGMLLTKNKKKLLLVPAGKKKVEIPKGVKEIADKILYGAKVKEIWLPKSLKTIGAAAFDLTDIKKWHIAKGSEYKKTKNCVYSKKSGELIYLYCFKTVKLPAEVTRIGLSFSISSDNGRIENLYLPKTFKEIEISTDIDGFLGSSSHLYFTSPKPPKVITNDQQLGIGFIPHIPGDNKEEYLKWLEENFSFYRERYEYATF